MKRWFGAGLNQKIKQWAITAVLPVRPAGIIFLTVAVWASIGCDSNSFVPPPRPELQSGGLATSSKTNAGSTTSATPVGGKAIEVVLGHHGVEESELAQGSARKQAGIDKVRIKIAALAEQEPSARQVSLVREALSRHPLALIVEPTTPADPALPAAVLEAQEAGVPVVVVGRALTDTKIAPETKGSAAKPESAAPKSANSSTVRPRIFVTAAPFAPIATQMVNSAIRNAKNAQLTPAGGAVILFDRKSDPFVDKRVAAVHDALLAAGVNKIERLPFEMQGKVATKLLTDFLRDNPKTVLVFSLDYQSFTANKEVCDEISEQRPFVSAGYTTDDSFTGIAFFGEFAGIGHLGSTRLLRKAITTAPTVASGRETPDRIEVPIAFFDTPTNAAAPRVPAARKTAKSPIH